MRCGYPSVTMASHSIWFGQCNAYIRARTQEGQVVGNSDCSRGFAINAGVR